MDIIWDDGLGGMDEWQMNKISRLQGMIDKMNRDMKSLILTPMRDLISVVIRKERASPCRQTFERSPLRNLTSKVLIEAMSREDLDSDDSEKLIRALFSIVNKEEDIFPGSCWVGVCRPLLLDATKGYGLLNSAYDVVVSAVIVLALVYRHLLGQLNGGGCRTYSSGSLDFRDTYISVLLFQGAFVWIWFRDVAPKKFYLRCRTRKDGRVTRTFEARFKPPRERVAAGEPWIPEPRHHGSYNTQPDAETASDIARFYYGKGEGRLELEDGIYFPIPPMTERERGLFGKEKANWVRAKTKAVFKDFKTAKAARSEVPEIDVGEQAVAPDSSLPTEQVPCSPCVNPTLSTNEVSKNEVTKFSLAVLDDSDMGGLHSSSLILFPDLGSDQEVDSGSPGGSPPPFPSENAFGREIDDFSPNFSVSDCLIAEPTCQSGIDARALIPDRNDANGSDLNSKQECLIEKQPAIPQEEHFEMNRRMSEQPEPQRLREQQLEEENFKLKRENEQIPELKRKVEQLESALLQVQQALRPHFPAI